MTIEEVDQILAELRNAYRKILTSQEYTTQDGRRLRRVDLSVISKEIRYYEAEKKRLLRGGGMVVRAGYTTGD